MVDAERQLLTRFLFDTHCVCLLGSQFASDVDPLSPPVVKPLGQGKQLVSPTIAL